LEKHFKHLKTNEKYANDTTAHLSCYSKVFKLIDADKSGFLEPNELPELTKAINTAYKKTTNRELDPQIINGILVDADSNGDNKIDPDEFNQIMEKIHELTITNIDRSVARKQGMVAKKINNVKLRTSGLSQFELDSYYDAKTLEQMLPVLNTGDLLLFRGNGAISKIIKKLTFCCFSHVAMVVRNPSPAIRKAYQLSDEFQKEEVFIFESNADTIPPRPGGGTHIVPLRWKLERAVRKEDPEYLLCVRQLTVPGPEPKFPGLEEFILSMQGKTYEMQKLDLLASTTVVGTIPLTEDLSSVFCTELLTASYKVMGLLSPKVNPTNSLPRTFTSDQRLFGKFTLKRGATLATETRIRCSKTREQLLKEFQEKNPEMATTEPVPIADVLQVTVISGTNLARSSSYAKVAFRDSKGKTKIQKKTNDPKWNESLDLALMSNWNDRTADAHLAFFLFSPAINDQFLGMGYLDLTAISLPFEGDVPLNTQGSVRVAVKHIKK